MMMIMAGDTCYFYHCMVINQPLCITACVQGTHGQDNDTIPGKSGVCNCAYRSGVLTNGKWSGSDCGTTMI